MLPWPAESSVTVLVEVETEVPLTEASVTVTVSFGPPATVIFESVMEGKRALATGIHLVPTH